MRGEIDLFYLSPELLLSYDIKHFVGERRIGLVVVDEGAYGNDMGQGVPCGLLVLGALPDCFETDSRL